MSNNLEYRINGWHAHSGAGPKHNKFWLAEYRDGRQVSYLRTDKNLTVLFKTLENANKRAAILNK